MKHAGTRRGLLGTSMHTVWRHPHVQCRIESITAPTAGFPVDPLHKSISHTRKPVREWRRVPTLPSALTHPQREPLLPSLPRRSRHDHVVLRIVDLVPYANDTLFEVNFQIFHVDPLHGSASRTRKPVQEESSSPDASLSITMSLNSMPNKPMHTRGMHGACCKIHADQTSCVC